MIHQHPAQDSLNTKNVCSPSQCFFLNMHSHEISKILGSSTFLFQVLCGALSLQGLHGLWSKWGKS
jgi:hypothetical protein